MYKRELIAKVARETRMSQRDVSDALNSILNVIEDALKHGILVTLPGFGTFYTRRHAGGTVRHIRSGKTIHYPARRQAAFRVGEVLARAVSGKKR